jgi:hypothetical protein
MGVEPDSHRILVNLVEKNGVLERRPSLRAVQIGYSSYTALNNDADDPAGGTDPITQSANKSWSYDWVTPDEQSATGVGGIAEGIDIEIVNGRILACYIVKNEIQDSGGLDSLDLYRYQFVTSWHHSSYPKIGRAMGGEIVATRTVNTSTSVSLPTNWSKFLYVASNWWNRRIAKHVDYFMITGKNVPRHLVVGNETVNQFVGETITTPWLSNTGSDSFVHSQPGISFDEGADGAKKIVDNTAIGDFSGNDADAKDMALWDGTNLRFYVDPEVVTNRDKVDPFTSIYCTHGPRNALAYVDRLGQWIWYGFTDGDTYTVDSEIPSDTVLLLKPDTDISSLRDSLTLKSYDVWYSDPMRPQTLPLTGLVSALNSGGSQKVTGLSEFGPGTVIFTPDTIQYVQGIGATDTFSRNIIHASIGCTSAHSIQAVSKGVGFVNDDGLYYLLEDRSVQKVSAFDELFADGVAVNRGPYDPMQGVETRPWPLGLPSQGEAAGVFGAVADMNPWINYQVDKSRLHKAVSGVWDSKYLFFVSATEDEPGDENRLVLVWDHQTNATSVWRLPKSNGVRGFAYDPELSYPYVMTRHGVAQFGSHKKKDLTWRSTGTLGAEYDVPILGQTHYLPNDDSAWTAAEGIINHTTAHSEDVNTTGGEIDYAMRMQMWASRNEQQLGAETISTANINMADHGALDGLCDASAFNGWWNNFKYSPDSGSTDETRWLDGPIHRTSYTRGSWTGIRHRLQYSTLSSGKVFSVTLVLKPTGPKGYRS